MAVTVWMDGKLFNLDDNTMSLSYVAEDSLEKSYVDSFLRWHTTTGTTICITWRL